MPLHGKIVVIKRSGGDGTEFPLTATCLFGRKPDCDIRIQLPHVSKEHCKIDLNENKEVILTNLSSSNPTRVNGKALQQSERLKHGDVITIIDRSFRFEYPPAPTPKKRSSHGGKAETLKVLQDQVGDTVIVTKGEKRISEVSSDPHLKDGGNHDNIQRSLEKTLEMESSKDDDQLQVDKTNSPFGDLYQMIKKSLDVKTPRTSSISVVQTPSSRFCTPGPASVRKKPAAFTPQREDGKVCGTPMSVKKQAPLFKVPSADVDGSRAEEAGQEADKSGEPSPRRRNSGTPQRFTVSEAIEQISTQTPKSPKRRRSKEATPARPAAGKGQEEEPETAPKSENPRRLSPRNAGKAEKESKKRKSGELGTDLPTQPMKRKRVSFGTHLSPELFDKRLPPDSPLRKGATPRRSLSLFKTKQALLRRVSVIGLLKEQSPVKKSSPSPKKPPKTQSASPKTPPGQKLPKSKSPSPKPASPANKSPESRSSSPKAASPSTNKVGTPKASEQPKTEDLASRGSPKSKRRSSLAMSSPASVTGATSDKTPSNSGIQTPTVQGRFSVSRISTPSPATEAAAEQEPAPTATPLLRLKRKSMKSASKKTPGVAKSAVKALQRRSGVSRASIKVMNSWVDIVKFGKSKAPVVLPTKKRITQKTAKKLVPKSQTPARKLAGHVSTGHAESPATIVVGRAHKRTVACPVGAAPRVVANTALFKKNMKMDEDLSGISEMFKTPANERKRRSLISESSSAKTPVSGQSTSVMEPSVLNTPEEPDEMMVSPLSAASTVKSRTYSSEAVQRLLDGDQESSFISDTPTVEAQSESSEQHPEDSRKTAVTTPKQKPDLPECLTGVRRIMKTPRQKAEPIEDLRGKLLKTPRQKAEQPECLTGVKRIMKTPRQKAEPIEDIRGKLLMTPKQKPEPQECLTGVKRIFKTPGRSELSEEGSDVAMELLQTPTSASPPEDSAVKTPGARMSPTVCLTDFRGQAAEDAVGTKRLPRTPKQKSQPVEEHFGLRRLMKSPRVKGNPPVEDFEGLQELMAEPEAELSCQLEPNKDEAPMHVDCGVQEEKVEADANEVVPDGTLEVQSECGSDEAWHGVEALPAESKADGAGEAPAEPSPQKKAARGRRANPVKAADRVEASEVPAAAAPLRARRGKKAEAAAPPAVRLRTRGANAGSTQSQDVEPAEKESLPQTSEAAPQPKRGRSAKKVPDAEAVPEPESQPQADEAPERAELKPRRGRKAKAAQQEESAEVPAADVAEDAGQADGDQPVGTEEASDAAELCVQAQDAGTETAPAIPQKRPTRGRRAKQLEPKEEEDKHQATESSNEPVAPAQVRGGRGRRAEAAAPPAVKQPARSRHAKSQESAPNHSAAETTAATEVSSDAAAPRAEASSVAPAEEVVSKPLRGRRAKATPCEPEKTLNAEPEQPSVGKPQRGRKAKPAAVEPNEEVEAKQLSVPPARAKRGRRAKPEEEERDTHTASEKADKSNEQAVEPEEEVQTSEVVPPEKAEAPLGTSEKAPKPRRGGRKAKAEAEAVAPVEPTEPQDVGSTDKPKRGRKNTRVPEEPAEGPEQVLKPNRAKGIKTKAKEELPLSTPAKRSRQGAAPPPQETPEEATAEPAPVQPAARGRRGAAKPSSAAGQDHPAEGSSEASAQDTTKSKRSVKWKSDLEEVHIPKATPVKAVRGRKQKIANQVDAESKATSEDAGRPEEDHLSDEAPPAKRGRRAARPADPPAEPPLPRTRRGRAAKK